MSGSPRLQVVVSDDLDVFKLMQSRFQAEAVTIDERRGEVVGLRFDIYGEPKVCGRFPIKNLKVRKPKTYEH